MSRKLLYMTTENVEDIVYVGIQKKIYSQLKCFSKNGIDAKLLYRNTCLNKLVDSSGTQLLEEFVSFTQKEYYEKVLQLIRRLKTEVIYIRYIMADEEMINFLKTVREEMNIKVLMEIPTYPYDNIMNTSPEPYLIADRQYRDSLKDYVDRLYNYSGYDEIYGMKTEKLINGVDIDKLPLRKLSDSDTFRMLSVSSVCRWHGYDRIIEGIRIYKKNGGSIPVRFTLAGLGNELNRLKAMVKKYKLDNEVKFLGNIRDADRLNELFDDADIGIGCLALYRVGINEGGAIKNQEYCARGIPFVISTPDPNFNNPEYIKLVPNDDTPVDIEALIEFSNSMKSIQNSNDMRQYAIDNLTWDKIFDKVISVIKA